MENVMGEMIKPLVKRAEDEQISLYIFHSVHILNRCDKLYFSHNRRPKRLMSDASAVSFHRYDLTRSCNIMSRWSCEPPLIFSQSKLKRKYAFRKWPFDSIRSLMNCLNIKSHFSFTTFLVDFLPISIGHLNGTRRCHR